MEQDLVTPFKNQFTPGVLVGFVLLNQKFLLVKNDIDVNEHERLFNITLRHKFKKNPITMLYSVI
jgi:hypothetical protein